MNNCSRLSATRARNSVSISSDGSVDKIFRKQSFLGFDVKLFLTRLLKF